MYSLLYCLICFFCLSIVEKTFNSEHIFEEQNSMERLKRGYLV